MQCYKVELSTSCDVCLSSSQTLLITNINYELCMHQKISQLWIADPIKLQYFSFHSKRNVVDKWIVYGCISDTILTLKLFNWEICRIQVWLEFLTFLIGHFMTNFSFIALKTVINKDSILVALVWAIWSQ